MSRPDPHHTPLLPRGAGDAWAPGPAGTWGPLSSVEAHEVSPWEGTDGPPRGWGDRVAQSAQHITDSPHLFDGPTIAVRDLVWAGERHVVLHWWEETFAAILARVEANRARRGPAPHPDGSNTVGVGIHVHLRCPQGWVIARRGPVFFGSGLWGPAASEALEVGELRHGFDVGDAARRALSEELGLDDLDDVQPWLWQHIWYDGWGVNLYAVASTCADIATIAEARHGSSGGWESEALGLWQPSAGLALPSGVCVVDSAGPWFQGLLLPTTTA
jgi:hypothetical protein